MVISTGRSAEPALASDAATAVDPTGGASVARDSPHDPPLRLLEADSAMFVAPHAAASTASDSESDIARAVRGAFIRRGPS